MRIRVEGGNPLSGHYKPAGSSNAAITLLAASLLTGDEVILDNLPQTASTQSMLEIAGRLGAEYVRKGDQLIIQTPQIARRTLSQEETSEFIGALLYSAPILVRRQYVRVEVDFPLNRIRTHLEALRDLGLDVVTVNGAVEIRAATWDYKDIILAQTSVTATAIVMMLAACFGQETVIHNAASEPHLQELAHLLEMMGAQIHGVPSNVLRVFGKPDLHGARVAIRPDHIEAASVAAMVALSGGRAQIGEVRQKDLRMIEKIYRRLGVQLDSDESELFVPRHELLVVSNREEDVDSSIETSPWPGFPSDLVAIATVIATQARGTSLIHEKLFNNRLLFVDKLNAMGAQIVLCDPHRAIVVGPTSLHAIYMDSPDVRTGLGMLGAALIAEDASIIDNAQALQRNFNGVIDKLRAMGAAITLEADQETAGISA
jgi:UDP-N-acetylglucosamine 1-carboxyvinyltransferase